MESKFHVAKKNVLNIISVVFAQVSITISIGREAGSINRNISAMQEIELRICARKEEI